MNFQGVSFNEKYWKTRSEAQFVAHEKHHGLSDAQLKEAYSLINPVVAMEATPHKKASKKNQPLDSGSARKRAE